MCGIVAYVGGAGNNLTRILTGMSAISYRAPDSTGVGIFGDDTEPIRLRKAVGAVDQLLERLHNQSLYPNMDSSMLAVWHAAPERPPLRQAQRRVLMFEGLPTAQLDLLEKGAATHLTFEALVDLEVAGPLQLYPGCPGRPDPIPPFHIHDRKGLDRLIQTLIHEYDLSPEVIRQLIRQALTAVFAKTPIHPGDITTEAMLHEVDQVFELCLWGRPPSQGGGLAGGKTVNNPQARKFLWRYLKTTRVVVPADYDRDAVRCVFRLLDTALLARLAQAPEMREALGRILEIQWPSDQRPGPMEWRRLYSLEKAVNLYGRAAAAGLICLQETELLPQLPRVTPDNTLLREKVIQRGYTHPFTLRALARPIISHGRWALQSAVSAVNAHPFTDPGLQRMVVLNGQFDPDTEEHLRRFITRVVGRELRSQNSTEYLPVLWAYYFELLTEARQRYDVVRGVVRSELDAFALGSRTIDYQVYHRVRGKTDAELDQAAFLEAIRRLILNGGQVAVTGMSMVSPRTLYVAGHNRPVFIVRRLENDDVMVVSDINAAMGLFPQGLIQNRIRDLRQLARCKSDDLVKLRQEIAPRQQLQACVRRYAAEEAALLEDFKVAVYTLDGEEIFACIQTGLAADGIARTVTITDFEGVPLPDITPVIQHLNPTQIRKDLNRTFFETHLHEVPDRIREILRFYQSEGRALPELDLRINRLRRRFGKKLPGLRRLVLIGTGSSRHMGQIARHVVERMIPTMDVVVFGPADDGDPLSVIAPEKDLVLLLSWSGTTAEMVQLAKRLHAAKVMMIGITEKRFGDMALIALKSGGVIATLSGEEVTVIGLKSTLCLLLCLLLGLGWISARKGMARRAQRLFDPLTRLSAALSSLLHNPQADAFCRLQAQRHLHCRACVVIDALHSTGIGAEIALKLEECCWSAIGKVYDYSDLLNRGPSPSWPAGLADCMVVVNATRLDRLDEALTVMEWFYQAGVAFVAVSVHNRHEDLIETYSNGHCLFMKRVHGVIQPFRELMLYYLLGFHLDAVHGRNAGMFPRNRAKSLTVARTFKERSPSATQEWLRLENLEQSLVIDGAPSREAAEPGFWERNARNDAVRRYYDAVRQLAFPLPFKGDGAEPLSAESVRLERLAAAMFDETADTGEIVLAPLDRRAMAAALNAALPWQRLLGYPVRVLAPRTPLVHLTESSLVFLIATQPGEPYDPKILPPVHVQMGPGFVSPGQPTPFSVADRTLLYRDLPCFDAPDADERLYLTLMELLIQAMAVKSPGRAMVLSNHLARIPMIVASILDNAVLHRAIHEIAAENRDYATGFYIGPATGCGLTWVDRFDRFSGMVAAAHAFGESAHGPLVTVDSQVARKFIRLESGERMQALYGGAVVRGWEKRYLTGQGVDCFLESPPRHPERHRQSPFYAEGAWYLPVIRPDYNAREDNLIFLDATSQYHYTQALDENATYGCRHPRLVLITQQAFQAAHSQRAFFKHPISHLLSVPGLPGVSGPVPISDLLRPFVINLLATEMASAWREAGMGEE